VLYVIGRSCQVGMVLSVRCNVKEHRLNIAVLKMRDICHCNLLGDERR
jgi:hypothetical protein